MTPCTSSSVTRGRHHCCSCTLTALSPQCRSTGRSLTTVHQAACRWRHRAAYSTAVLSSSPEWVGFINDSLITFMNRLSNDVCVCVSCGSTVMSITQQTHNTHQSPVSIRRMSCRTSCGQTWTNQITGSESVEPTGQLPALVTVPSVCRWEEQQTNTNTQIHDVRYSVKCVCHQISAFESEGRESAWPSLLHNSNSSQLRVSLEGVTARVNYSRFSLELLSVGDSGFQGRVDVHRSIDDEYTPSIFKVRLKTLIK